MAAHPLHLVLLPLLLVAAPPPVLDCPPGTTLRGGAPPEQYEAWCSGRPDAAGEARRHGPARTWYDDGSPWVDSSWAEGKRDGPWLERHRNGRKAVEGTYRADAKVGRWTIWFESGQPEEACEWADGVQHGAYASWYRGGARRTEGRYCLGAQCGTWTTWDESGRQLGSMQFGERQARP
jgi:hypothetical protein